MFSRTIGREEASRGKISQREADYCWLEYNYQLL